MATTVSLTEFAGLTLKQKLARAERINRLKAQGLILPLLVFLFVVFLLPIGVLLYKSVENPEVVGSLPRTVEAISTWDGRGLPDEPVYRALALDRKMRAMQIPRVRLEGSSLEDAVNYLTSLSRTADTTGTLA